MKNLPPAQLQKLKQVMAEARSTIGDLPQGQQNTVVALNRLAAVSRGGRPVGRSGGGMARPGNTYRPPVANRPVTTRPVSNRPVTNRPVTTRPVTTRPSNNRRFVVNQPNRPNPPNRPNRQIDQGEHRRCSRWWIGCRPLNRRSDSQSGEFESSVRQSTACLCQFGVCRFWFRRTEPAGSANLW